MTLAELLDAGLQLQGDVWTMLPPWCFTPIGGVNRSLWMDPRLQSTSLAPIDEFELWSRRSWHLAIGDKEDPSWVSCNAQTTYLPNTLLWTTVAQNGEMRVTLWDFWANQSVSVIGRSVCSKKAVEDFLDIHFSCMIVEGRVVDSNMDGFSGNVFAILVYYLEVGDAGMGVIVGNAVYVNCTGDLTVVSIYSIFKTSANFSYVRKATIFFWAGQFVDYVFFKLW